MHFANTGEHQIWRTSNITIFQSVVLTCDDVKVQKYKYKSAPSATFRPSWEKWTPHLNSNICWMCRLLCLHRCHGNQCLNRRKDKCQLHRKRCKSLIKAARNSAHLWRFKLSFETLDAATVADISPPVSRPSLGSTKSPFAVTLSLSLLYN